MNKYPVDSADIGGGVRIETIDDTWFQSVKQQCYKVRARADILGSYTHRFYISVDPTASSPFDITEAELQPLFKAITLSHIVKPNPAAIDDIKVRTTYEGNGSMHHLCKVGNANMSVALGDNYNAITDEDCQQMVSLWPSLTEILEDSNLKTPKYDRIVRAIKNFEYAHYIYFANLSYLAYHAALEFIIYFGSVRQNRAQVVGRLPLLLPGLVSSQDALDIYNLNLHYKHGPEPSGPFVSASINSEVLRLTSLLREFVRQLLLRALNDRTFTDTISDHDLMKKKHGVRGNKGQTI